jgi:hypothetical protein
MEEKVLLWMSFRNYQQEAEFTCLSAHVDCSIYSPFYGTLGLIVMQFELAEK